MSNAGIRMSVFPTCTVTGWCCPKRLATTQYNNVPLLMLTGSTELACLQRGMHTLAALK